MSNHEKLYVCAEKMNSIDFNKGEAEELEWKLKDIIEEVPWLSEQNVQCQMRISQQDDKIFKMQQCPDQPRSCIDPAITLITSGVVSRPINE